MLSVETIAVVPDASQRHNTILSVTAKRRATSAATLVRHIVSKKNILVRQMNSDGLIAENPAIGLLVISYMILAYGSDFSEFLFAVSDNRVDEVSTSEALHLLRIGYHVSVCVWFQQCLDRIPAVIGVPDRSNQWCYQNSTHFAAFWFEGSGYTMDTCFQLSNEWKQK
ncbi:hypothetical protein J1614_004199 [Plenodomus biglobosus]|nr:hypothetical protein J1614_004199 [Plenodomus biglobosus]